MTITMKNCLKYIPCTESRLHQVFIDTRQEPKKVDRHVRRLLSTITSLRKKGFIKAETKQVPGKDGEYIARTEYVKV